MDKLLPYLLLGLLVIATWNESLSHRVRRIVNKGTPAEQVELADGTETPTSLSSNTQSGQASAPRATPFWQQQGYRSVLDPNKSKSH